MKKRKLLLLMIITLLTVAALSFGVVASAYTVKINDSKQVQEYDPQVYRDELDNAALSGLRNLVSWDYYKLADVPRSAGPFYFEQGASLHTVNPNFMCFNLYCTSVDWIDYAYSHNKEMFLFEITILRQGTVDSEFYELSSYQIIYNALKEELTIWNLNEIKQYYSSEFSPIVSDFTNLPAQGIEDFVFKYIASTGHGRFRIAFEVPSVYNEYRILFRAARIPQQSRKVWDVWPFKSHYEIYYDTENVEEQYIIASDVRSYYQVVDAINDANKIDEQFQTVEMQTYAREILAGEETEVTVSYLENVGENIPFAKKVEKNIKVKTWENATTLSADDVETALGHKINTLISPVKPTLKLNTETGVYEAEYYPSVYLEAKTVDGNNMQYILNPNLTYAEFYSQFVNDGIFSQDLYDYLYSTKILTAYPALGNLAPEDLYGYWGYVLIPETFTFNQAFAELFNTQLKFDGIVKSFDYDHSITLESYNKLLKNYDYAWLERIWNDVWGTLTQCNAKHLVIFADCTSSDAFANMNGSDAIEDSDGLISNEVSGVITEIGTVVKDTVSNVHSKGATAGLALLVAFVIIIYLYKDQIFKKAR